MPAPKDPAEPVSELRSIPIRETHEPLVDFLEVCPELVWSAEHPVFDYERFRLARRGLVERLCRAAALLPRGVRLAVVEGYRAPAIQRAMHAATRERLRRAHPEWSPERLQLETDRFSAPMDLEVPPPHTTGGAVDLHLVDRHGEMLDLTSPYSLLDPRGAPAEPPGLSVTAAANRRLLREVLLEAGITNYPSEWWHWSYGDQGWAYRGGHPHALYGAVPPPGGDEEEPLFRVRQQVS